MIGVPATKQNSVIQTYEGHSASRCGIPDSGVGAAGYPGFWQCTAITYHEALADANFCRIVWPGFIMPGPANEYDVGAAMTLSASIEYPANSGKFIDVPFNGALTGYCSGVSQNFVSDYFRFQRRKGQLFGLRIDLRMPSAINSGSIGIPLMNVVQDDTANISRGAREGARNNNNAAGIANPSLLHGGGSGQSHADGYNDPVNTFRPIVITGDINERSVAIFGDSIALGRYDVYDSSLRKGFFERSLPYPHANFSRAGEQANGVIASSPRRVALVNQYFSHVISNYGHNDIVSGGATDAQLVSYMSTFTTGFPGKRILPCTLTPYTTDGTALAQPTTAPWQLEATQTVAATNGYRESYNASVRAGLISGCIGFVDVNLAATSTLNTSKWMGGQKINGLLAPLTTDGIHPNHIGNAMIAGSMLYNTL